MCKTFSLAGAAAAGLLACALVARATPVPLNISQLPLMATHNVTPNVLLIMDNSNSMDEAPNGSAVGSASADSKSEIARTAAQAIIERYQGRMNMGLMAYQQGNMEIRSLSNSLYDVSYDPAHYDPQWTGTRASPTHKRFRHPNPDDPGRHIYYNVALPFYGNSGGSHCFSTTADAAPSAANPDGFRTIEQLHGPWDTYQCYRGKTGTSNILAASAGYAGFLGTGQFSPTDSDYAQNIYDFGQRIFDYPVGQTWYSNISPGRGYLHTPIRPLDGSHKALLERKLGTSQFSHNRPTDAGSPLQNAGLTPLEGTLLTALDYFGGQWRNTTEGYTFACYPLPESCAKDYVVLLTDGLPSTRPDGAIITDMAAGLAQTADAARRLRDAGVHTYIIGFALPFGTNPRQLDVIAQAGGTDTAYSATDPDSLSQAMQAIFSDIAAKSASASAVAANSTSISRDTVLYQARFDPRDWSGMLSAHRISATQVQEPPLWQARIPQVRTLLTYHTGDKRGVPFTWDRLDPRQQRQIGSAEVLSYLRGNQAREGGSGGMRRRTSLLGDIVNSSPVFVGAPEMGYTDASYLAFRKAHAHRRKMVYVGANDGMLHAFDATTGEERFAYVPSTVVPHLRALSSAAYVHRFYVDGTPTVADALVNGRWRTVLVGGLGAGGQGIYALDITDPDQVTEADAAAAVLWEFGDRQTGDPGSPLNFDGDMGYSFSRPSVVRTRGGDWLALFGNGYNNAEPDAAASASGNAVLYGVALETGALAFKMDTGRGAAHSSRKTPNGLSTPAVADLDSDGIADWVYAGDLQGNLWRFDLTASSNAQGRIRRMTTPWAGTTLNGPITVRPEVRIRHGQSTSHVQVLYGSGQGFEVGDHGPEASRQPHYFASLMDEGEGGSPSGYSQLKPVNVAQGSANADGLVTSMPLRLIPRNPSRTGNWIMELPDAGERVLTDPILHQRRIIFTTAVPNAQMCAAGGHSWLMELTLNGEGAEREAASLFDINGDAQVNAADRYADTRGDTGGTQLSGIASRPLILGNGQQETKVMNSSQGLKTVAESKGPLGNKRISWRDATPADVFPLGLD